MTRVRFEPTSCDQNRRKNDALFALSATLPTYYERMVKPLSMMLVRTLLYCKFNDFKAIELV